MKFITNRNFSNEKNQTVTISDIQNVLKLNRLEKLFDIYETPIRIEVAQNSPSQLLSEYLSIFYRDACFIEIQDACFIEIQDAYLSERENENNLNQFILKYVNKARCEILFVLNWTATTKTNLELKFTNYNGYNTKVKSLKARQAHPSHIRTEDYRIDLGYRLKIFGKNNKTENEIIKISKIKVKL